MQRDNYSPETMKRYERALITLTNRSADLDNPESIKDVMAKQKWADGTKQSVVNAIMLYYKYKKITASFPKYRSQREIPFIPMEQELDQLIAGCKHRLATFLQTLKETACRYGEAYMLKWIDYDTENATLNITPEKGSNPRQLHISAKLQSMLNTLPHTEKTIFAYANKEVVRKNFQRARKRIANNLGNPRLMQIHFHTFRHWKATTFYHDTRDTMQTMKLLGHKCLNNTQLYIQILPEGLDRFVCAFAETKEEDKKLIEAGYEFHTKRDNTNIYRKRK
jgi:integrase